MYNRCNFVAPHLLDLYFVMVKYHAMKIRFLLSAFAVFFYNVSIAQAIIFAESMGTVSSNTAIALHETNNGFDNDAYTMTSGGATLPADIRNSMPSSTYLDATGAGNVWFTNTNGQHGFAIEGIDASTYNNLTLQFGYRKESASVHATFRVEYWNGTSWINVANTAATLFNEAANAGTGWYLSRVLSLPAAAQINGLKIRFVKTGTNPIRIDDVKLTGTLLPTLDFNNLQWPGTATINEGEDFTAYAKAYEPGITEAAGHNSAVNVWIGYSSTNSNPGDAGWTWIPASYHLQVGNDDEYALTFGSTLPEGIYYYASRFQLGSGPFTYGGYSSSNGGAWNGTTNVSGILVVNGSTTVDYANLQTPATGNYTIGGVFNVYAQVYEPLVTTTPSHQGEGISAWIGYSSSNTNPASGSWTWVPANFNAFNGDPNNDEYMLDLGGQLTTPGTYYYASRFQLDSGAYRYGGIRSDGNPGGFWNGTEFISGVLTVSAAGQQEIVVRGVVGANPTIPDGDTTPSGTDNTLFAAQVIGTPQTKWFRIQNTGSALLSVTSIALSGGNSGDFTITASAPYSIPFAGTNYIDFSITFQPTALGIRSTTVVITNNDLDENPYNFVIQGSGTCDVATNMVTPLSGPVGTEVTVTATANNLSGATASVNGIPASVTQISPTQITVVIPPGAVSGNLITVNAQGCSSSTTFTVIDNAITSCEGVGSLPSDLFISQVTDSGADGMSYIEIYNGTGSTVNLGSYSLRFYNNGSGTVNGGNIALNNTALATGEVYIVATGISNPVCTSLPGGNAEFADQASTTGGINFKNGSNNSIGHDHIRLFKNATHVDSWGTYENDGWATSLNLEGEGANFIRKNTATVPSITFNNADWNITDWGEECSDLDYSDIGTFDFSVGVPPTVTVHPNYTPTCKTVTLTVTGTEGFSGGNPLAFQWFSVAPNATTWTALSNDAIYSGVTSATLNISDVSLLDGYQFYSQVRENDASCYSASNAVKIDVQTATWNGSWSPSLPMIGSKVVIAANYDTALHGSFEACSVLVNPGQTLIIGSDDYVEIQHDLMVNGNLLIEDSGSLVMIDDSGIVTNTGATEVTRTTQPYKKYDYTYWSSPVDAANIGITFPAWRTDFSFSYNTSAFSDLAPFDGFDDDGNDWVYAGPTATMTPGKGYIVMAPTTGTFPTTNSVTFSGAVNNGIVTVPLAMSAVAANTDDDFNLVGNPYPSAVSGTDFINSNPDISGTLYFWSHVTAVSTATPGPDYSNYNRDDYALFNLTGGTRASLTTPQSGVPSGLIASGQGFFIEADAATDVIFNNSMRSKLHDNGDFFRGSSDQQQDRIWLNLSNPDDLFSQQLIGYFPEATLSRDWGYDGIVAKSGNTVSFYSMIGEDHFRIQGRPEFTDSDIVPLGYSTAVGGDFTISIDTAEGQLAGAQPVIIEDMMTGVMHDLKQAPYTFSTEPGTFEERFLLRYNSEVLATGDLISGDLVFVAVKDGVISVYSESENLSDISVYDLLGRLLYDAAQITAATHHISNISSAKQPLIVKIKLLDGQEVIRKIIF